MKLSIIVPTYKQNPYYLYQCINSIFTQYDFDYTKLEVIVVKDDLEPQSTLDCIKNFPTKVIQVPRNLGCGGSRQLGLQYATGDVIYFMDSDDFLFSCYSLKHIMRTVEDHQDKLGWVFSYYHENDKCNYQHNMVSLYAIVFKKSEIEKYNIQFSRFNRYEDACFIGQYMYCVGFNNIHKDETFPIYFYRNIPTSITKSSITNSELLCADIESCWIVYQSLKKYNKYSQCFYIYMLIRFAKEMDWVLSTDSTLLPLEFQEKWNILLDAANPFWENMTDEFLETTKKIFGEQWIPIEQIDLYRKFRF